MSQEDVEIVRGLWEAAERRDDAAVFALYDPAVEWESHLTGSLEGGGCYYGHEGVRRFFRDWLESFENYEAHPDTFIDAGSAVVVGYRVSGRGKESGAVVQMTRWNVYQLENGLVTRVEIFDTEDDAVAAAYAAASSDHSR